MPAATYSSRSEIGMCADAAADNSTPVGSWYERVYSRQEGKNANGITGWKPAPVRLRGYIKRG